MKIVAHRGYSHIAPENTLAAIKKALKVGVYGIEVDVNLTADGIPVVIHSDSLSKVTSKNNHKKVSSQSFSNLKNIDIGSWFAQIFAKQRISTLDEVMKVVLPKAKLYIDLKENGPKTDWLIYQVAKLIKKHNAYHQVEVLSYYNRSLKQVKQHSKKINVRKLVFFCSSHLPFYIDKKIRFSKLEKLSFVDGFNIDYGLDQKMTQKLTKLRKKVSVGFRSTISDKKILQLQDWGVEFIMRNHVEKYLEPNRPWWKFYPLVRKKIKYLLAK